MFLPLLQGIMISPIAFVLRLQRIPLLHLLPSLLSFISKPLAPRWPPTELYNPQILTTRHYPSMCFWQPLNLTFNPPTLKCNPELPFGMHSWNTWRRNTSVKLKSCTFISLCTVIKALLECPLVSYNKKWCRQACL